MNRTIFFAELRKRNSGVFGTSLSQKQVDGIEAILDAGSHLDAPSMAYVLATAYWETGRKMFPNVENLNYTTTKRLMQVWPSRFKTSAQAAPFVRNPRALANKVYNGRLGNRPGTDDGWNYRGRGMDHNTGRDNYRRSGRDVGVDLMKDPDALLRPDVAAKVIVTGMEKGRYRPGHTLARYFSPGAVDFRGARAIINSDVSKNGPKVAAIARAFLRALGIAGWKPTPKTAPPSVRPAERRERVSPPKPPEKRPKGLWAVLMALLGQQRRR